MRRAACLAATCFLVSACAGGPNISFNPFGGGEPRLSSAQKCTSQGYREDTAIFGECVSFYDKQASTNRRNIALAVGVAVLGVVAFEGQCDCLFGPDRGEKFSD